MVSSVSWFVILAAFEIAWYVRRLWSSECLAHQRDPHRGIVTLRWRIVVRWVLV